MYCKIDEVKRACNYPSDDAPISDKAIQENILASTDEVNLIYRTKFYHACVESTATEGTASSLTDSNRVWEKDGWKDYVVYITGGTGSGQYRKITSNTLNVLSVTPDFSTTPDNTSTYEITTLGYKNETLDGSGSDTMLLTNHPLQNLISLTIDDTSVTPSRVYQYTSGKIVLGTNAEKTQFLSSYPQQIEVEYIYGVDELPKVIKRLCVLLSSMRCLSAQIAGTYDDFTSVSLPNLSGSKGEPYTNIRDSIMRMQAEAKAIVGIKGSGQIEDRGWMVYIPHSHFG